MLAAIALGLAAGAARAQEGESPAAPSAPSVSEPAGASAGCCTVPARTLVEIEILDRINSKTNRTRDRFAIRLAEPLIVEGRLIAPAGTRGVGEVVHAAKAGSSGKAGELILAARYLELDGSQIKLRSFRYGQSAGRDKTGSVAVGNMVAAAVLPVASVLGFLVSGGNVDIPAGTRASAQTAEALVLAPRDAVTNQE